MPNSDRMATSVHNLPPELLDMVLELVAVHARWDMLACTSVCSLWRIRGLIILLRSITFKLNPDELAESDKYSPTRQSRCIKRFLAMLNRYPGLGRSIFTVQFVFGSLAVPRARQSFLALLDILSTRCRRIRTLEIRFAVAANTWHAAQLQKKLCEFAALETLKLHECTIRARDLLAISRALPRLKVLDLGSRFVIDSRQSSDKDDGAEKANGECQVRTLNIVSKTSASDPGPLCDLLQDGPFRHVSILSISLQSDTICAMQCFVPYITYLGPSLRHLEVWDSQGTDYLRAYHCLGQYHARLLTIHDRSGLFPTSSIGSLQEHVVTVACPWS